MGLTIGYHILNPPLQLWFSSFLRNSRRNSRKLRFCNCIFAIFTKGNLLHVDFTKKFQFGAKSRGGEFAELLHCELNCQLQKFSLTIFSQKFRETNGCTKELTKELIWRNIWWERISRFSTLWYIHNLSRTIRFLVFPHYCAFFLGSK